MPHERGKDLSEHFCYSVGGRIDGRYDGSHGGLVINNKHASLGPP